MKTIMASVGKSAINRPNDVRSVQTLLNQQSLPNQNGKLTVDGVRGPKTIRHIESFQRHALKFSQPDGRIDPRGRTMAGLAKKHAAVNRAQVSSLTISAKGLWVLKTKECLSLVPYDDQTGKEISKHKAGATIGYGHLIACSEWAEYEKGISEAQAEMLLKKDLAPYISTVRRKITADVTQQQFDALVIFAFNIGIGAFSNSSVAKLVNDPTAITGHPSLKSAWMVWNRSQGKEMRGLVNRRNTEWNIYDKGVYQ